MAELVLRILIWLSAIGLVLFCGLYLVVKPWRDPMGRHILAFMGSLGLAFCYLLLAPNIISRQERIYGWIITIGAIMVTIWWRVAMLIKFQLKNRETLYEIWLKIKRK